MTRDFTSAGPITMTHIAARRVTTALVTFDQARDLFIELQHLVRYEPCAEHDEDGSFRALKHVHPQWHSIKIRPLSDTQIAALRDWRTGPKQLERISHEQIAYDPLRDVHA